MEGIYKVQSDEYLFETTATVSILSSEIFKVPKCRSRGKQLFFRRNSTADRLNPTDFRTAAVFSVIAIFHKINI